MRLGNDTRALVTGASRGIGRAVAEELLGRGATVGLISRNPEALSGNSIPLAADVGDRGQVEDAVTRFVAEAGGIDVLVANAGVAYYGPFRDASVEEAEEMTRVNWLGTVYSVHAALPHMLDRASGHIAIISSVAGLRTFPWAAVYGATKAAQRGFAEALRHELSGTGVELSAVYPGEVETHLHDHARAHGRMPDWRRQGAGITATVAAQAILGGIEQRQAAVYVPANTRLLRILHGLSPALADRVLRAILGASAAPAGRSR